VLSIEELVRILDAAFTPLPWRLTKRSDKEEVRATLLAYLVNHVLYTPQNWEH